MTDNDTIDVMNRPKVDEDQDSKRQEAIDNARVIVAEIMDGKKDVVHGAKEVFYDALIEYDFPAETKKYVYDSIGLEKAYGLLDACMDLSDADHGWHKRKTNEQLLEEARTMLFEELKQWQSKS